MSATIQPQVIKSILVKRKASEDLDHNRPIKRVKFEEPCQDGHLLKTVLPEMISEIFSHCDKYSLLMARVAFRKDALINKVVEQTFKRQAKVKTAMDEEYQELLVCNRNETPNLFEFAYLHGITTENVNLMREVFPYMDRDKVYAKQMYFSATTTENAAVLQQVFEHFGCDPIKNCFYEIVPVVCSLSQECFAFFFEKVGGFISKSDLPECSASVLEYLWKKRLLECLLLNEQICYADFERHIALYPFPPLQ